jgi:hypothetical protein
MTPPSLKTLGNVTAIVVGVIIASIGEIKFVFIGFVCAMLGVAFEATRLAMVERLLSSAEFKMDPMVSLYYFAPVCAIMNGSVALFREVPYLTVEKVMDLGLFTLLANASVAFLLNLSVVFLVSPLPDLNPSSSIDLLQIGKTSALVLTLSGVLKDILLVLASMIIFLDPVSPLQAFGYSIALAGLVYYKLGGEKLRGFLADGQRQWHEYGTRAPIMRRIIVVGLAALALFVILGGLAPRAGYDVGKITSALADKAN